MKRTLRSNDVEGCSPLTTTFARVMKSFIFIPMFVLWGMASANAQELECTPTIEISCPPTVTVACDQVENTELTGMPVVDLNSCDNAYEVSVEFSDAPVMGGTACSYSIIRTWVAYVPGTYLSATCTQTVNVIDNVGPVFTPLEDISVQCIEDVVAPEASAMDECSDVTITSFESHTAGVIETCVLTTPMGPGPDGSLWLFGAAASGNAASDWWSWVGNPTLTVYDDGTAHIVGSVQNNGNAAQAWDVSVWLQNRADWTTWSGLGRWYKNDLGLAGNNYLNWDYYELVAGFSTLTGTGAYAGNILYLSHQPSNFFFGWQSGIAANNRNANDGLSGWFYYNGWFNGSWVNGHGDIFTNKQCTPNNPQLQCEDEVTYFFRATDACGNATIESQVVSVEDTIAPEFTNCPEGFTIECGEELPAVAEGIAATDNCDDEVVILYLGEQTNTSEDNCTTIVTRTWSAEDDCGNRTFCIQEISIVDTTAPEFTFVPEAVTFECDEEIIRGDATATDICQGDNVSIIVEEEIVEGNCPQNYDIVRTFYANDGCGNVETATQIISIVDTTAPVFDEFIPYVTIECDELDEYVAPTAQDNCGLVTVVLEEEMLNSGGCLGVLERHYVATDECGNSTTAIVFIALQDNTAPTIENPADFQVECDNVPSQPEVPVFDNCEGAVTVDMNAEIFPGECENSYTIVWTWVATDFCENVSTASTTVTVVDTTIPVFGEVPGDITLECSDELPAVVLPSATDNCDEDVEVSHTDMIEPGECPNEYTIVRMFRAFDNCGNQAMAVQYINVVDTTSPVMEGVAELSFECDEDIVYIEPSATDNCEGAVTITFEDVVYEEGNCFSQFGRIYTATDVCGNFSTFTQVVTVVDTTAPVITGTIEIDRPCDDYNGIYVETTDNCNEWSIDFTDEMVSGGCQGRVIRTYTATDACQNSSSFTQIITLTDEVAPVAVEQTENTIIECGSEYSIPFVQWSDNCDDELETNMTMVSEGSCPEVITYTFTAEDNCGNIGTATVVYTIVDTTDPIVTAPNGNEFSCEQEVVYGEATAEDVCSDVVITFEDAIIPGSCPNNFTIVRTWFGTDACGNVGTATTEYNVFDLTPPTFNEFQSEYTVECSDELPVYEMSATDNCVGDVVITGSEETIEGECANNFTVVRTYTATDACGNFSQAVVTINVVDTTAPEITGLIEIDRPCDDFMGIYVEASDNCAEVVSIDYSDEMVSGGCQGRVIRTYVAVDNCGNSSEFTQIITLTDEVAPVAVEQSENATIECGTEYSAPFVEWSDNCDNELETNMTMVSEGSCPEVITYTFTAEDNCGNVSEVVIVYTIVDTTVPVWEGESYSINVDCSETAEFSVPSAFDQCSSVSIDSNMETIEGTCPAIYTEVYTYLATDACGNVSEPFVITVNYTDSAAPTWETVPSSDEFSCDQEFEFVMPTASDDCSEFEITFVQNIIDGECPNNYTIERVYTATDACGNVSETVTVSYFIFDNQAPVFETELSDLNFDCPVEVTPVDVVVTDNCSEVTVTSNVETIWSDECGNGFFRVFYVAVDACGNASEAEYFVNIYDETAPVLSETPGDLVLDCETSLPEAPVVTATDNCGGEIEVVFEETIIGDMPAEGSIADCNLLTPALPEGNPCNYNYDWAMALFAMPTAHRYYQVVEGSLVQYEDRIEVTAQLGNAQNLANGFFVTVTFTNPLTWAEWSSQSFPTGFKADCGGVDANHPDWIYYLLEAGDGAELVGYGAYAGSAINLVHAPSNNYFGFQLGNGANNYNAAENGFGGWFTYNGVFLVNGSPIMSGNAAGAGDFAFELDCCPDYSVVRTWTAMDCTGNTVTHTQTITWAGSTNNDNNGGDASEEAAEEAIANLDIIALWPNPSINSSDVQIASKIDSNVMLDVIDVTGRTVAKLFDGRVEAGQVYKFTLNTSALNNGLYQVRLISNNEVSTKQLQVVK